MTTRETTNEIPVIYMQHFNRDLHKTWPLLEKTTSIFIIYRKFPFRWCIWNRLIILTFVWRLIRMVNFSNDSITSVMTLISLVNFAYLSSNIPEYLPMVLWFKWIRYVRVCSKYEDFLFRGYILFSKLLKQGYLFLTETSTYFSEILWSSYRPCSHIGHLCVTYVDWSVHWLWHMTVFQLFCVNRDGCHMWGRKCSLFSEHLISLPLGSSWFYSFAIYMYLHCVLLNLSVLGPCLQINDWFVFLD